ncbi:MAG: hypothetical protein ACKVOJ_00620 [Sphingomonadaceae bacterium]
MNSEIVRRRIAGWAIALLIEVLIIIALLSLGQQSFGPADRDSTLSTFTVGPDAPAKPEPKRETTKAAPKPEVQQPIQPPPPPRPPTIVPPVKVVTPPSPNKGFIELSKDDLAAGDIGKLGAKSGAKSASTSGPAAGVIGPGQGPGGEPIYNVEWVREPTDAELAPYFEQARSRPAGARAVIACRMIANNRVENCQSLGETPPGTGLARALRLASWQFRVRPPRIGDKPQLGVWVRIIFDFTEPAKPDE